VQNGAASTAHKYLHHGLEALTDAAPVRRLRHARMARRSFVESPRLDAVGRARTRQLAKAAWSRQLLGRDRLMSAVFAITYACPLACGHCSVRAVRSRGTLDHRACLDVLDQLAAVGAIKVAFFGGEPTTRRDLPELVAHGARLGLQCSVDSSGMGLDEALARELARARVSNVNISLDHPDPAQHDQLRGRAGAWLAAQAAVAALRTHGIPVLIGTWAGRDRIHDGSIARLIELAKDWDTQGLKLLHPILSGCLAAAEEQRLTVQDLRALHTLAEPGFVYLEDAFALDKPSRHRCSSLAKQMVYIAPDGQLQPCPGLPISFGSLADEPLAPLLERMWGHELYRWRACTPDACLANDPSFRARYLRALEGEPLPLPVEQLPPLWPEDSP
jgi:MoaA/NifB/PqqE/SkfB family radical SAM enzyme